MSGAVQLKTSPHLRSMHAVDKIMRHVVVALLPVCAFSILQFGLSALALILVCTTVCLGTEHFFCKLTGKPTTLADWSAAITGILMALILPPGFPLWMAAVASFVSIAVGKQFFGGLGYNVFNPALVGRAFAQAAFTVPITTWTPGMAHRRFSEVIPTTLTPPFLQPDMERFVAWVEQLKIDGYTGATPLAMMKFDNLEADKLELFLGTLASSAGESSALLILVGGLYLACRRMLDWRIPAGVLGSAFVVSGFFYLQNSAEFPSPFFTLVSGGLMLGAVFMATDMVSSPVTPMGIWLYGILIGSVTVIIRLFGGLNEGVMYAILLGNAAAPLLNNLTQPRVFGSSTVLRRKMRSSKAGTSSIRLLLTLGGIALFSGALLALTYEVTKPLIAENERAALEEAVVQVIPGATAGQNLALQDGELKEVPLAEATLYAGLDGEGNRIGFALPGEARGYADVIRVLYGYDPATKTIIGLQVLSSNETPGLGDKIQKDPEFAANFTALDASLENDIVTVKSGEKTEPWQIDGISGATVSSMAVGKALQDSTRKWVPMILDAIQMEGK